MTKGSNVVWGDTNYATNIVWGAQVLRANNIVWGDAMPAGEITPIAINGEK